MKQLIIATHNEGKLREIRALLEQEPVQVLSLKDLGWQEEISETGDSFKANALIKARTVFQKKGLPVLADDSGLSIKALGGAPGVLSARYLGEETAYEVKNQAILDLLARVPERDRGAVYDCAMAFVYPGRRGPREKTVRGRVRGRIAYSPAGEGGFGYDPIFYLPERACTMAQLPKEDKNAISHRGEALRAILPFLKEWLKKP